MTISQRSIAIEQRVAGLRNTLSPLILFLSFSRSCGPCCAATLGPDQLYKTHSLASKICQYTAITTCKNNSSYPFLNQHPAAVAMAPLSPLPSMWRSLATSTLILSTLLTAPFTSANPACTYLHIPLTATASNEVFPIPTSLNFSDSAAVSAFVQTILGDAGTAYPLIPTTFTGIVAARYCEPEVKIANRSDVIQMFVSGVTENNLYWFGLGYPNGFHGDAYSTVDHASKQGYPTLSIDRIGVGNSTRPDPILQQQVNLEEAVSHQLVTMLKAGTAVPGKSVLFSLDLPLRYYNICKHEVEKPYTCPTRQEIQPHHLCRPLLRLRPRQRPGHQPPFRHIRLHPHRLRRLNHPRRPGPPPDSSLPGLPLLPPLRRLPSWLPRHIIRFRSTHLPMGKSRFLRRRNF